MLEILSEPVLCAPLAAEFFLNNRRTFFDQRKKHMCRPLWPSPTLLPILESAKRNADTLGKSRLRESRLTSDRHDVGLGHLNFMHHKTVTFAV